MGADAKTTILLAVDLAPGEPTWLVDGAVDMARDLVRDRADHVVVLHVREFSIARLAAMMREHGGAEGRHAVDEIVARLRAAGVTASGLIREADEGHVAGTILDAAGEFNARVIVLGSPKHRIPMVSVAKRLMRQTDVPVVVAPRSGAIPGLFTVPRSTSSSSSSGTGSAVRDFGHRTSRHASQRPAGTGL